MRINEWEGKEEGRMKMNKKNNSSFLHLSVRHPLYSSDLNPIVKTADEKTIYN